MKKLFSVLLVIALMLGCAATPAEGIRHSSAAGTAFTSVTGVYTCQLPDGYSVMDAGMLTDINNGMTAAQLAEAYGITDEVAEIFIAIGSGSDASCTDVIYSNDYTGFIIAQVMGSGIPSDYLSLMVTELDDSMKSSFEGLDYDPQGMITIGAHELYAFYAYDQDYSFRIYMAITNSECMLFFGFYGIPEADCLQLLSTMEFTD